MTNLTEFPPTSEPVHEPPPARRRADRSGSWQRFLLQDHFTSFSFALDALMLVLAVWLALRWAAAAGSDMDGTEAVWMFPLFGVGWFWARGLYRRQLKVTFLDDLPAMVGALSLATMTLLTVLVIADAVLRAGLMSVRVWLLAVPLVAAGRLLRASLQRHERRRGKMGEPALIIGAGIVGLQVARRLQQFPEYGLRPVGFVDDDHASGQIDGWELPRLGRLRDFVRAAQLSGATHVIIAFSPVSDERLVAIARACHVMGLELSVVPRLFDVVGRRIDVEHIGGLPLLDLEAIDPRGWQFAIKHVLDRTVAALAILLLSPLLIGLALAVRLSSPGPVFYRQRRVGRDGEAFDVLKFRSMRPPRDGPEGFRPREGVAPGGIEGEDRRTGIGKVMRATSLDELPQLFNVLAGEMSLVGPRPERPEFVSLFEERIRRYGERHRVKAGITGWAQVHGLRGQTSIADRAEWDNYYIENWSLALDIKILALTALTLFRRTED